MGNEILYNTYLLSLTLQRNNCKVKSILSISSANYSELINSRDSFLHLEEQKYFDSFTNRKRQYSYLVGRYCAKQAISSYIPSSDIKAILIQKGIFEQPIVTFPSHPNIQISISHTDQLGVALVFPEEHPMAIDIEMICQSKIDTIQYLLTTWEQGLLSADADLATQLVLFWTVKEALSKVLKCGFTLSFEILEIAKIVPHHEIIISYFKHFIQYKAVSFFIGNNICTIVLPRKTRFNLDQEIFKVIDKENNG